MAGRSSLLRPEPGNPRPGGASLPTSRPPRHETSYIRLTRSLPSWMIGSCGPSGEPEMEAITLPFMK
jgi:hypothetical protein